MRQRSQPHARLCLLMLLVAAPTLAVMSDDDSPRPTPSDPDYAAGLAAFERADWQGVIASMGQVLARRSWHDDAHNLMGYAYRKLGDYPRALEHYQQALGLNPHHRGALEYLGETYLAMGRLTEAHTTLTRLEIACKRITSDGSADGWKSGCEEWQELKAAIDSYRATAQ
ncbi:MAG: tetratricopeptide repeat protein [Candidatus Entotheonellia bacterium]